MPQRTNKKQQQLVVERLNDGRPIIAPQGDGWESRGTGNPGAIYLERSASNDTIIAGLLSDAALQDPRVREGIVAVTYNGGGPVPEGVYPRGCHRGLAIFTPRMEQLKRFAEPVLYPSSNPADVDCHGVEDARINRIGDTFYLCYCGYDGREGYACMAQSRDLLHWEKLGKMPGNINAYQNKDHVLFDQEIDGWYWCLHRPWAAPFEQKDYAIRLARAKSPLGPWQDCGVILRSFQHPRRLITWVGGGSPPIAIGENRFLMIYHNGCIFEDGWRQYNACAAILNFNRWNPDRPDDLIEARFEDFFVPETPAEINEDPRCRIRIISPVGSYVFGEDLHLIYGAGDICSCAARVNKNALVQAVEESGLGNKNDEQIPRF